MLEVAYSPKVAPQAAISAHGIKAAVGLVAVGTEVAVANFVRFLVERLSRPFKTLLARLAGLVSEGADFLPPHSEHVGHCVSSLVLLFQLKGHLLV